jgi:hypothetical protein
MKYISILVVLSAGMILCSPAYAGMRCGNDLVNENDSYFTVTNKCGSPCYEEDLAQGDNKTYSGKKVSYYCINGYTYILTFQNSVLQNINSTHDKCTACQKK